MRNILSIWIIIVAGVLLSTWASTHGIYSKDASFSFSKKDFPKLFLAALILLLCICTMHS